MRAVIQRVSHASVVVESKEVSKISKGYLILLGVETTDTEADIDWLANKISKLRIFSDKEGKMNVSIMDIEGSILVISQFTLFASTKKGNRPSFMNAAGGNVANEKYENFCQALRSLGITVMQGIFGADMKVSLLNDGPVTIIIDSKNKE